MITHQIGLSSLSDEPSKVASARPKKHSHSHKRHDTEPKPASDQYSGQSEEPWVASSRSKKHADKSKYKVRSRYVSSSAEEDQSSAPRHRSSKSSGPLSDQDQPQRDPDPPYYREVVLFDVPSQYAEEVDTFRHILSLPDPRESSFLGPPPQSWVWTTRSSGQVVLLLCSPSAQLSKMLLINLRMTFRLLIYLRVNISNLLLPLLSGTRWDSLVMRTRSRS